jgi:hypothetical protein
LSDIVADIAAEGAPADTASSQNDGRSRREYRTVEVFPASNALVPTERGPFICAGRSFRHRRPVVIAT